MMSIAMLRTKHWNNAYSVMRTANGLGFDNVYLVDLVSVRPPRMNRRKIEMGKRPWSMFKLVHYEEFLEKILPQYNAVSMELTARAVNLKDFTWPVKPLLILGPENGDIPIEVLQRSDQVKVPMEGLVQCFNVSCAGSIAMWDYVVKGG